MKRRSLFRPKNVKRQVRQKRRQWLVKSLAVLGLVTAVGVGSAWALTHWEFFSLKKIEIRGESQRLSQDDILKQTHVRLGENLFKVDLDQIQQKLKGHEYFKRISVQRRLPQTLVITLEEYQPQFILYTSRFYYVDRDGEIFKDITDTGESRDFPILTGFQEEDLLQRPLWVQGVLKEAIQLKKEYLESPFARRFGLSEIHFQKNIGFTLYPEKQKYSIKFGSKGFGEKTHKLTQVLGELDNTEAQFSSIDLNYPGKVLMTL